MSSTGNPKSSVKDVCKKFILKSDELFANKLQYEECVDHYNKNRMLKQSNRANLQKSMPLVKSFQNLNIEKSRKEIEENDAMIALAMQQEYLKEVDTQSLRQELKDKELAKRLQQDEIFSDDQSDDLSLAIYLQDQEQKKIKLQTEITSKSNERLKLNDEVLAKKLQNDEEAELNITSKSSIKNEKIKISTETHKSSLCYLSSSSTSSSTSSLTSSQSLVNNQQDNCLQNVNLDRLNKTQNYSKLFSNTNKIKMSCDYGILRTYNNMEEETLIKSLDSKLLTITPKYDLINPKIDAKGDTTKDLLNNSSNICAVIDPTFKNKAETVLIEADGDNTSIFSGKTSRNGYVSISDTDTEMFLPIQGQKRDTLKSFKKKKSNTQCLQQ